MLVVAIMEFGRLGFAYNSVSFAAHRAARYAAVHGSASANPASAANIQAQALNYMAALDSTKATVTTTWTSDNNPGSTVQVAVTYGFYTILVPLSKSLLTVRTTASQVITQ
jgi:Flp pilus assembly protein TadG